MFSVAAVHVRYQAVEASLSLAYVGKDGGSGAKGACTALVIGSASSSDSVREQGLVQNSTVRHLIRVPHRHNHVLVFALCLCVRMLR